MTRIIQSYLTLILASLICFNARGQKATDCDVKLNGKYALSYWQDSKKLITAPARWEKKDWLTFGGVAVASSFLYLYVDQDLKDWSQINKTSESKDVADVVEKFGNGRYPVFTTAGLYILV